MKRGKAVLALGVLAGAAALGLGGNQRVGVFASRSPFRPGTTCGRTVPGHGSGIRGTRTPAGRLRR